MSDLLLPADTVLTHELEIKRSRFLALVTRAGTPDEAREVITERRATMPDARHHCTAFIISVPDALAISHSSDDGEPSGTAGRPMLDVLAGTGLVDVVAVVTRYFGGTLLGSGGLVRAYSDSVRQCMEGAAVVGRERLPVWRALATHVDAGRYLASLNGAGYEAQAEYLPEGVRITVASDDGAALADLLARLSSGAVKLEAAGWRTVERPVGKIEAGTVAAS
ncbi:MAG: YigZ family protein [Actinomycetaceae bacterium]|nr:YigZ family protein [Actinomycetaceae bacterium]